MLRDARIALDAGDTQAGLRQLRRTAEAFPGEIVPILELWNFHQTVGLPDTEAAELRSLLTRRLADAESPLPPGVLKYLVENPDSSDDELELVLRSAVARSSVAPQDAELIESMGLLQLRLGRKDDARRSFGRLLELQPTDEARWRCIELDMQLERWEQAASLLAVFIEREPSPPWARINYVRALGKLGRYEELAGQLDQLDADRQILMEAIGEILLEAAWEFRDRGRDAEAEQLFRKLVETKPYSEEAQAALLYLYSSEEERHEREMQLRQVWKEESDPVKVLDRGASLLAAGDAAAALGFLERAAAELPDSEIAWYNLGLAAFRLERFDLAVEALGRAERINPARAEAWFNRGAALQKLDRCVEAVPELRRALELQPELSQAYFYLYVCHRALGDREASDDAYRRYSAGQDKR